MLGVGPDTGSCFSLWAYEITVSFCSDSMGLCRDTWLVCTALLLFIVL